MDCQKYQFWRALRPFSFAVALCACLTGICAAYAAGFSAPWLAALVLLAGLLLQAGVNLINDYADLPLLHNQPVARALIQRNFRIGMACFTAAAVIALYLIAQTGLALLWVSVVGLVGALTYTLGPVNYKARGLGVVLVFWLMGVLMVSGSYLVIAGSWSMGVVWQSIPVSLLVALLLLSNELRDYEADRADGIGTLAVRMGFKPACRLYGALLLLVWGCVFVLWQQQLLAVIWPVVLTAPLAWLPLRLLAGSREQRRQLTPQTGRLLAVFGLAYCYCLLA